MTALTDDDVVMDAWIARLQSAAQAGTTLDLAADLDPDSPDRDPTFADNWGAERHLPAAALRAVLIDRTLRVDPRGLRINGARITTALDLENVHFDYPLYLTQCRIEGLADLSGTTFKELRLTGSHVKTLALDGTSIGSGVFADAGFCALGEVRAPGARIGGQLTLRGATLANPGGVALNLDSAVIDGDFIADQGFSATGRVSAHGVKITGPLILRGATFVNPDGEALNLDNAAIDGSVFANDGFSATGRVSAHGARIGGQLTLRGGTFVNPGGEALVLDNAAIDGSVFANDGFSATGRVSAHSARIGGQLALRDSTFTNSSDVALSLDNIVVGSGVIANGMSVSGQARAHSATLSGQLELRGATLINPDGVALSLEHATVGGHVFADQGFSAEGRVRAHSATFSGQLVLRGATLINPDGVALSLDSATITTLILTPNQVLGTVSLVRTTITDLKIETDSLSDAPLIATGWVINDLHGTLRSDRDAAAHWLRTYPSGRSFTAQPWHALAAVYDRNGQPADARRLRYLAANEITKHAPPSSKPLRWIYRVIAGHGYYPLIASAWLLFALVLGIALVSFNRADFVPTNPAAARAAASAYDAINPGSELPHAITANEDCANYPDYPCFNPVNFALTNVIPAANSNLRPDWTTSSQASVLVTWGLPVLRISSWIFTAILLAGVTGLLRKT
ncbi:hypothetical protein [Rhodococcus qingshengii]|nr:hypothetical protein [Rhodococcus qingshengii]